MFLDGSHIEDADEDFNDTGKRKRMIAEQSYSMADAMLAARTK